MPGFYDSDSDDSTVDGRRGSVYVAGGGLRERACMLVLASCAECLVAAAGLDVLWRRC